MQNNASIMENKKGKIPDGKVVELLIERIFEVVLSFHFHFVLFCCIGFVNNYICKWSNNFK